MYIHAWDSIAIDNTESGGHGEAEQTGKTPTAPGACVNNYHVITFIILI